VNRNGQCFVLHGDTHVVAVSVLWPRCIVWLGVREMQDWRSEAVQCVLLCDIILCSVLQLRAMVIDRKH
jgi:hypothetical protein